MGIHGGPEDEYLSMCDARMLKELAWVPRAKRAYELKYSAERIDKYMNKGKLGHRTSLKLPDWQRYNYASTFGAYRRDVIGDMCRVQRDSEARDALKAAGKALPDKPLVGGLRRVHAADFTEAQFIAQFEAPLVPCVINGIADDWPARDAWTLEAMNDGPYRNVRMKCGEDDDGYSIKVRLKYFLQYMFAQRDDSPLYLFDSNFDDHAVAKGLVNDYKLPRFFADDLFNLVGAKRRPPHRWFLVGPERAGTTLHIDPLATSAWNTLLSGMKLWVLYKPSCSKAYVRGDELKKKGEDSEAITWFMKSVARIRAREEKKRTARRAAKRQRFGVPGDDDDDVKLDSDDDEIGMVQYIQLPGETMFVPGGWWHAVVNLR
jgi:histone arginine demethylase JMJD6